MPKRWPTRLSSALVAAALVACDDGGRSSQPAPTTTTVVTTTTTTTTPPAAPAAVKVVAAGDIACAPRTRVSPTQCQMGATADLVEAIDPVAVLALGDLQYEYGEREHFDASYDRTWGRFKDRTYPAVGNHDWGRTSGAGYFDYFGERAGPMGKGWYSFDLPNGWHGIALNSVCSAVGCGEGSEQLAWLRADLEASSARCTVAFWHHPYKSSGLHGPDSSVAPLWAALRDAGVDVALGGHDHHYERFAPEGSLRQFVVGTGGRNTYPVLFRRAGSESVFTTGFGVLELSLRPDGYDWRFRGVPGVAFSDAGSAACT